MMIIVFDLMRKSGVLVIFTKNPWINDRLSVVLSKFNKIITRLVEWVT